MANELKDLIAYLADKINYEVGEDDSVSMKRPGGGGQEGIFYYSPNLKPWILAQRALKLLNTPDHSEAIAALERVRAILIQRRAECDGPSVAEIELLQQGFDSSIQAIDAELGPPFAAAEGDFKFHLAHEGG